eukprot:7125803-Karenia_brevis.AAC.1
MALIPDGGWLAGFVSSMRRLVCQVSYFDAVGSARLEASYSGACGCRYVLWLAGGFREFHGSRPTWELAVADIDCGRLA